MLGTVAQRILGSPDVYEARRRSPLSQRQLRHRARRLHARRPHRRTTTKHNAANGEDNNDGESDNKSSNGGAEGPTDDDAVNERRDRQRRNLLATLLLSAGVPMLLGGDEIGRTQGGNNNAYCQDNEISWFDWDARRRTSCSRSPATLIALRRENPALRPPWFRHAPGGSGDAPTRSCSCASDAEEFADEDWDNPDARTITFVLGHEGGDAFALLLNAAENGVEFQVPRGARTAEWELAVSSDPEQQVVERRSPR